MMEMYDKAIADFDRAIELDPSLEEAYRELGRTYYHLGDYTSAIDNLSKAIELEPGDYLSYFYRGSVYYEDNENELALQDFMKIAGSSDDAALIYQSEQYIVKIEVDAE
jgi:tetratricopeptide (TPR) repeat protein